MDIKRFDRMSKDIELAEREKLKSVFPQCFNEGKLDIDKLLNLCGEYIDEDFEKYKFEWKGKADCYKIAGMRSTGTLRPCPAESVNFDETQNLYIEGDNLEVLKLLQTAYYHRVKMIYIDPPYNTGNDFVYEDDFSDPMEKYKEVTAQTTKSNPETMGRFHTNWLNMMFPRLRLAANLLRDDGVIFISIDENEISNLKKLCNEVFGEENYIGSFIWRKKDGGGQAKEHFVIEHEFIVVYQKGQQFVWYDKEEARDISQYNKQDERGKFKITKLAKWGNTARREDRPSMYFSILAPDGTETFPIAPDGNDGRWRVGRERMDEIIKNNLVHWEKKDNKWIPYEKEYFANQVKIIKQRSILYDIANTGDGSNVLTELFSKKDMFENPKPIELLKCFLEATTKENDIILDFFSGSGTTAHAVMQLNAEDGGNRKFICVQLPEVCDEKSEAFKAGYKNICEIGKERIRRAGEKILSEYQKEGIDPSAKAKEILRPKGLRMTNNSHPESHNNVILSVSEGANTCHPEPQGEGSKAKEILHPEGFRMTENSHPEPHNNVILSVSEGSMHGIDSSDIRPQNDEEERDSSGFALRMTNNRHPEPQGEGSMAEIDLSVSSKPQDDNEECHPEGVKRLKDLKQRDSSCFALRMTGGDYIDIGFKVFKLDSSNLFRWNSSPTQDEMELAMRILKMEKTVKSDRSPLDLVYEVMLKLGIPLDYKVFPIEINDKKCYSIGEDCLVLVCTDRGEDGITPEDIEAMCEYLPAKIVTSEESFKDDTALSNAYYILNAKEIKMELL